MAKKYTLHDLPADERPRERLQKVGTDNLSLQELLALIIEKGGRSQNVLQVAQNLLSHFGSLEKMKEASLEELKEVKGIGFANACKLKAALKLGDKLGVAQKGYGDKITEANDVYELLKPVIGIRKQEHFVILCLDARSCLISVDEIAVGSLNIASIHPREIFAAAIANRSASIILAHNHPSGNPAPSRGDIKITNRLRKAGELIGIEVQDHIVVTETAYSSILRSN